MEPEYAIKALGSDGVVYEFPVCTTIYYDIRKLAHIVTVVVKVGVMDFNQQLLIEDIEDMPTSLRNIYISRKYELSDS